MIGTLCTLALVPFMQQDGLDRPPPPTWHADIAPIIQTQCGDCHDSDGPGPFPLETFEDVSSRSRFIEHVVREGLMPPWLPTSGVHISGERRLTAAEKATLEAWVQAGAPEGTPLEDAMDGSDGRVAPPNNALVRHEARMRSPWEVPAEGGVRWFKAERDKRTFILPLGNDRPLRIQSIEYRTRASLALAATAISADNTGQARRMVDWDAEPGSYMMGDIGFNPAGSLGVVGPGGGRLVYPDGFHVEVPERSDLVSEVHFRPQGRAWTLSDAISLEETPAERSSRQLVPLNVMVRKIELDIDEVRDFKSSIVLPMAVDLVAMTPRASRRCRSLAIKIMSPDATTATELLTIADWNPHYRETLVLEDPIRLAAGTRIDVSWTYDNTTENPRNPVIPPEVVSLGARVGSAHVLFMCAPVDPSETNRLQAFSDAETRRRQR